MVLVVTNLTFLGNKMILLILLNNRIQGNLGFQVWPCTYGSIIENKNGHKVPDP